MARARAANTSPDSTAGVAFLLCQVGAYASARFAECLVPLDLVAPHVGILQVVKRADGLSQQALGRSSACFRAGWWPCSTSWNSAAWWNGATVRPIAGLTRSI